MENLSFPDEKTRHALQSQLIKELHNISIVDIRKVREVVSSTTKSISQAFILMAFLSVLSGFLIFAFMLHYSLRARLKNMALLSASGLEISKIKKKSKIPPDFFYKNQGVISLSKFQESHYRYR